MIVIISKKEREILDGLRLLKQIEDGTNGLPGQIVKLKTQISDLEVQRSRREEEVARQERELKHMIGLEKKRQEWEIEVAKKDTSLTVREGNLAAAQKRFEEQLAFNTDRFEKMESYLKDMMSNILERLPNVNVELRRRR